MNILFVADVSIAQVIGGAERVLHEQTTGLAKRGHCVYVLTRQTDRHRGFEEHIEGVCEWRYPVESASSLPYFLSTLQNGRQTAARLIKNVAFDVINYHQPFSAFAVDSLKTARSIAKIYTCHSLSFEEYQTRQIGRSVSVLSGAQRAVRRWIEKSALDSCRKVIVLSRFSKDKVIQAHGISSSKIEIIAGGVDPERFVPAVDKNAAKRALGIDPEEFSLFTLRNLVPRMGLDTLLEAIAILKPRIPRLRLYLGGNGPLKNNLEALCLRLNLADTVRMTGFMNDDQILPYYQMADFFVLPTRALEGFGLTTVEALACGTPVLGTPVGATQEILENFNADLLFRDASAQAMADLIEQHYIRLQNDRQTYAALSRLCRKQAAQRYSWKNNIDQTEKVFLECAASAAKSI